jgi:hypothetical protein
VRRTDRHRCLFYSKKQGRDNIDCKKERVRDKIKRTGNEKVPKTVNGETVASQWLKAEVAIPM